jgi:hypothetical protein
VHVLGDQHSDQERLLVDAERQREEAPHLTALSLA